MLIKDGAFKLLNILLLLFDFGGHRNIILDVVGHRRLKLWKHPKLFHGLGHSGRFYHPSHYGFHKLLGGKGRSRVHRHISDRVPGRVQLLKSR
jgi:hypothetical protein